jgi:hypothetical protein
MLTIAPTKSSGQELVTFKAFAALARERSWTVQSLAARFRGRIQNPAEFFNRILDARSPDNLVPYRAVRPDWLSARYVD